MINFNKQKRNKIASILIVLCGSHVFSSETSGWTTLAPGPGSQKSMQTALEESVNEPWEYIQHGDVPLLQDGRILRYKTDYLDQATYKIEGAPIMRYTALEGYALVSDGYTRHDWEIEGTHVLRGPKLSHNNEPATEQVDDLRTILRFSKRYQDDTQEIYFIDTLHYEEGYYLGFAKYNLCINTKIKYTKINFPGEESQRTDQVSLITNLVMNESLIYQVLDMLRIYGTCLMEASPVILRTDIENHVECVCCRTSTHAKNVRLSSNCPVEGEFSRVEPAEEHEADDGFTNIIP